MTSLTCIGGQLFLAKEELGVLRTSVSLVRMTLRGTCSKVRVQGQLSGDFEARQGLKNGYILSTLLFNISLEPVMRKIATKPGGTIFNRKT